MMVGPASSGLVGSPGPVSGPLSPTGASTAGRPCVVVRGLPAEAGTLVRVLLVQGEAVVADQLLPASLPDQHSTADGGGGLRSVR